MQKYLYVSKLAIQDLFVYKFDFLLNTLKYSLMVIMMTLVWLAVERDGGVGILDQQQVVSYFILSAMVYTLSNFHPWYIEDDIRLGQLSKFLVKPLSPMVYYFFYEAASVFFETVMKMFVFMSILYFTNLLPSFSFVNILILCLYMPFIFTFAFFWLSLTSQLAFWITEAFAVRWAVSIFTRLLSGILVPILYFPESVQQIFQFLPFQHLAFTPIQFMLGNITPLTLLQNLLILLSWTVVLVFLHRSVWMYGLKNYEGTGI